MTRPPRRRRLATTETEPLPVTDDAGEDELETGPLRRCIVTRDRLPKERMIRFVIGPDRQLVPDLAARLPGRGMWLSASADVLDLTNAKEAGRPKERQGGNRQAADAASRLLLRAFARAARGPVFVPPDLYGILQAGLIRRISDFVGLARRAGQAVAGFEKAREILRTSRSRLVLQASDGSEAERKRFLSGFELAGSELEGASGSAPGIVVIDPLPGDVLGRIFGRDYVVHVAVAPGKLAESLVHEAGRLAGLKNRSARATGSARATEQETVSVNEVAGANG